MLCLLESPLSCLALSCANKTTLAIVHKYLYLLSLRTAYYVNLVTIFDFAGDSAAIVSFRFCMQLGTYLTVVAAAAVAVVVGVAATGCGGRSFAVES